MAYDPKDPKDKKIVDDAVAAALAEAAEEHEEAVAGLKSKNKELLGKLKKARENNGGEDNSAEVERLETELAQAKKDLSAATKAQSKAERERDEYKATADSESKAARDLLVNNGLTEALTANNVAAQFLPAAKAMLSGQVTIKADGDKRTAMVGDKALGDYVKEWAASDAGKHFVTAPANGGSNANGGKATETNTGKTMTRSAWDAADQGTRAQFSKDGGKVIDG